MAITTLQTNKSVFAIKEETTEGTPVTPSAATDFIPVQEGASVTPSFDELENNEFAGTIGIRKNVLGLENPTASMDMYFKPSGSEGAEPNWGILLEALLGDKTVNATEYDTVAGSTTSEIEVDTDEGENFYRGQALLVKDATNGYAIRNVNTISTDTLNLAQELSDAPADGINLGKAITYLPADSGHPTVTFWNYVANGGAIQMMAGGRPVSLDISADAAQQISGSFSMEGVKFYFNPVEITSSNQYVDFDEGSGEVSATVPTGVYVTPQDLASALETAMDNAATATVTVSYSSTTGKYSIESDGATFELPWATGTNTANSIGSTLGFDTTADDTGETSYTADDAVSWAAEYTPTYDDVEIPVAKNNQVLFGTSDEVLCFQSATVGINITNTKADILSVCSSSGKDSTVFTERSNSITVTGYLTQGDARLFERFRTNEDLIFTYNFGTKSGGNWVPGKCWNVHFPKVRIQEFSLTDTDGVVTVEMTLQPFVADGLGEVYINHL